MINRIRGSALVEYVLPIALIGLVVGVGIYSFFSSDNLNKFFASTFKSQYNSSSKLLEINKNSDKVSLLINPNAGIYSGSSAQPIKMCDGIKCTIDFGEFILTGIPENFADYVNSQGNSGGIDELCKLLYQIAAQLEQKGDIAGAIEYRNLANLGYFMADFQEVIENSSNSCLASGASGSAFYTCVNKKLNDFNFNTPSNLASIIPSFSDANFDDMVRSGSLSIPIAMEQYKAGLYNESSQGSFPSYRIVKSIDKIGSDPKYSVSQKAVTEELYKALVTLTEDSFCKYWSIRNYALTGSSSLTFKQRDYITGATIGSYTIDVDNSLYKQMVNPLSKVTDLDSTLICTTGKNKSNGEACN